MKSWRQVERRLWVVTCLVVIATASLTVLRSAPLDTKGNKLYRFVIGTGFAHGGGRYHLFYDTRTCNDDYRIAYAYSEDGLYWTKPSLGLVEHEGNKENNLLDFPIEPKGSWNEMMMSSCGVLFQPDKWRMWIAGYHKDASGALHAQLGYGESPDPTHWKLVGDQPVIRNGPPGTFDWGFVRVPCVIKDGEMYRMYYTAGDGKGGWFVGYAESPDGQHWAKPNLGIHEYGGTKANNLVLAPEKSRGEQRVTHPWVFKDGDIYRIYYSVSLDGRTYGIGTGTSVDGIHWVKNPQTVVLPRGPKGAFDYWYAAIPKVVHDTHDYQMWYTGYNGGEQANAEEAYALGYATSRDGVHWEKYDGNPVLGVGSAAGNQPAKKRSSTPRRGFHDCIEVRNPKVLGVNHLPAERVALGLPGDYKPCIVKLPGGELLVVAFRTTDLGSGEYREDPVLFRSHDVGRSWSEGAVLKNVLGREPYLTVLKNGVLLMTSLLGHDVRNTFGYFPSYVHRSEDGGCTWTATHLGEDILPPRLQRRQYEGNQICTTRNLLELSDGTLLMGVSVYGVRRDFVWRSHDQGKTWRERWPSRFVGLPERYPYGAYQEAVLWQARSGKLYAIARRDHRACPIPGKRMAEEMMKDSFDEYNLMVVYSSSDLGRTWTPVGALGDYGEHYPSILRLQDGRLLLTFTVRALKPPLGVRAVLGREDQDGFHIDFDHDQIMLDTKTPLGMTSGGGFGPTVQLDDGTLITAYSYRCGKDESNVRLEVVRWRLPVPGKTPL